MSNVQRTSVDLSWPAEMWPRGGRSWRRAGALALAGAAMAAQFAGAAPASATAAPRPVALWSMSPDADSMNLWRTVLITGGLVHSEGSINLHRVRGRITGGTEYGAAFNHSFTKLKFDPAAVKVQPGQGNPATPDIADYRPGGAIASAATSYAAVDPANCVNGSWTPSAHQDLSGIVYVPCGLVLRGGKQRTIDATFVAEGPILVTKTKLTVGPCHGGGPALISAASGDAIVIARAKVTTRGTVYAPAGVLRIAASATTLTGGAQAQKFDLYQAAIKIPTP